MSENSTIKAKAKFFVRRNTVAGWEAKNPILGSGEIGAVTDSTDNSKRMKLGDGKTAWNDLPWITAGELSFNPESENAQSGLAVAEAVADKTLSIKGETGQLSYGQESGLYIIRKGTEISAQLKNGNTTIIWVSGIEVPVDTYLSVRYFYEAKTTVFDLVYPENMTMVAKRFKIVRAGGFNEIPEKDVITEEAVSISGLGVSTPNEDSPSSQIANKEYVDNASTANKGYVDGVLLDYMPKWAEGTYYEKTGRYSLAMLYKTLMLSNSTYTSHLEFSESRALLHSIKCILSAEEGEDSSTDFTLTKGNAKLQYGSKDVVLEGIATPDENSPDNQAVNKAYVDSLIGDINTVLSSIVDVEEG